MSVEINTVLLQSKINKNKMANLINKETLFETYSDYGNEFIIDIIDIFLNEYEEKINFIDEGIKTNDAEKVHFWSHKLKGSIKAFFAPEPAEIAYTIEKLSTAGVFEGVEDLFIKLKEECVKFIAELNELKDELK